MQGPRELQPLVYRWMDVVVRLNSASRGDGLVLNDGGEGIGSEDMWVCEDKL
jgi:hypothetical protein